MLRFATLTSQSYWFDEAQAAHELHLSFGGMLGAWSSGEPNPPLYFLVAWPWARLFGTGEAGLRSLSALLGTALIPLVDSNVNDELMANAPKWLDEERFDITAKAPAAALLAPTGNGANNGFTSDNHVYVFSIDQSGVITQATGSPFATVYIPSTLTVHPNGTFVYTFNQTVTGTSPTEGLQFNPTTGALSFLAGSPFTALTAPSGQFDESGAYLFMHPGTSVSVASVNTTTGALTSIATPIANVGSGVGWAVTDPH